MSVAQQIRTRGGRASGWTGAWTRMLLAIGVLTVPNLASAATLSSLSGKILGLVTDAAGSPQMGAAVTLLTDKDGLYARALTDEKGSFSFDGLLSGVYSVRVTLASFMPVARNNVLVQPGLRTLLNVSLAGMFSSIQLVYPTPDQRAIMNDDWKWVLRTSAATRPILRFLPGWKSNDDGAEHRVLSGIFSDTRALVQLSAGDGGRVTSFGNEADLGTAFALATSVYGKNQIQFSGNLGYAAQSGAPSAGFRTSYSRAGDADELGPEVTVTMRQMFIPGRVTASLAPYSGPSGAPELRTVSLSVHDGTQLTDALRVEYGASLDAVSFIGKLNYFSPYARLEYALSDKDELKFSYTSGVPQVDDFKNATDSERDLQSDLTALALFPRISLRDSHAQIQQSQNFEMGYRRTAGSREYAVAVFHENVSNAALTIAGGDGLLPSGDILPDLFTTSSVFNAGSYQSNGYMASVSQRLGGSYKLNITYGSGDTLLTGGNEMPSQSPDDLRSMIRRGRRQSVTTQMAGAVPLTGTRFTASYQWTDRHALTPTHYYATEGMRAEAGLNIYVRQPIRTFSLVPVRMEASADLRNLLAEGYLPFTYGNGQQILLMHTPRSFRGGLTFIF